MLILFVSIFLSKEIKSLKISKIVIELTIPVVIISLFFIILFKDLNLISILTLKIDSFYVFFRILFLFFFIFCLYSYKNYFFLDKIYLYEFPLILLLSIEGSFLMLMTDNLFTFYLALEIQNLCFYIMASLKRYSNFSTEAGLKYFLLGVFSSSLLLFGISLLYGLLGTLDLREIYILVNYENFDYLNIVLFISMFFFICGLLFKLGSVPFHYLFMDVYEGSPTIVTMFFSIFPKIVLSFFLIKLYFLLFIFDLKFFSFIFLVCGLLSIFIGIINAMYQYKIKRFLAYSSIVNVGFILVAFSTMSFDGFFSGLYYVFCYLFSISLIFFILINIRRYNYKEFFNLFDFSNLNSLNSLLLLFICIIFLSFAGIPPLIGFFGKFFVFFSLFNSYNYLILFIIFVLSVASSFYYLRVIRFFYFTKVFEFNYIYYLNLNYMFYVLFYFNILFFIFFDYFGEFFYFILIQTFF
jgi:NADH-quinone oxidoreductase subunit N